MSIIYEPKGRAAEYAQLAANLFIGCSHGCRFPCYAAGLVRKTPEQFALDPHPRKDILKLLERDARALAGDPRHIHLCFTCDSYQPGEAEWGITRQAIKTLLANQLKVEILTKGGELAERDLDLLASTPGNRFGITLTTLARARAADMEPGAALPLKRFQALKKAKAMGIGTKVSLEPVIWPGDSLAIILSTHEHVDHFAVGKWNAGSAGCGIDWPGVRYSAVTLLETLGFRRLRDPHAPRRGRTYYIKKDLETA